MELYKRLILILTMGIMAIGIITYKIDADSSGSPKQVETDDASSPENVLSDNGTQQTSDNTAVDEGTPFAVNNTVPSGAEAEGSDTDTPTQAPDEPTPTPEPNPLKCEVYPQIHTLIEKYFQAKLSCDIEQFREIVTDVSYINIESIARATESVRDYTDLTVYTKRGYGDIDLVVYCTFNMIVPRVDSPIASIDSFYIVYDDEGNPRIFSGILDDEVMDKLAVMDNDDEVLALKNYVATEIAHAMEKDESLVEFWENMLSGITIDELEETIGTNSEE